VALLAGVIWAYPAAIATLVGFILYQSAEWVHVGGIVLPVLTLIDVVVIYLTLREWRARQAG
jgi:Predicted membrane protein